jgi:hypothetical protein
MKSQDQFPHLPTCVKCFKTNEFFLQSPTANGTWVNRKVEKVGPLVEKEYNYQRSKGVMAHWYSPFWDPGISRKVVGTNPVECMWNSLPMNLTYQVWSGVVLQKKKDKTLIPPSIKRLGHINVFPMFTHCSISQVDPLFQFPSFRQRRLISSLGHPTSPIVHNCPTFPNVHQFSNFLWGLGQLHYVCALFHFFQV